ncbi:ribbon-helix-helix protein, CopG family [Geodermatophilus sp. DF01-2]|uniref:ribbon-helix-helix domain-containing protein n=1 Tax=Geodermatophilus sp. DF01-2 TaxID=2559610 RepID=UPI001073D4E9|nr:ribbon-helix-helix protein, CopG family [Geodermatophilus sp. DF01_2]
MLFADTDGDDLAVGVVELAVRRPKALKPLAGDVELGPSDAGQVTADVADAEVLTGRTPVREVVDDRGCGRDDLRRGTVASMSVSDPPAGPAAGRSGPRGEVVARKGRGPWPRRWRATAAYQLVDRRPTLPCMSTQIAIRLDDDELAALDAEVRAGRAASRSDAVRRGIAYIQRAQRYRAEDATLSELAERGEPVYPEFEGMKDLPHLPLD